MNGQVRGSADQEDASKRKGKVSRGSGVHVSREHLPWQCADSIQRFGIIRFMAYVTDAGDRYNHILVARVALFGEEEVGPHGQVVIDPRRPRRHPFFVRLKDLGNAQAFVPVRQRGDGKKELQEMKSWSRKQYVVPSYPVE